MSARIDKLDLKMLRVLAVVARTRNTYRAAEELYLSQSAVSRALSRLRDALDDPVFVRTSDGLEATALTERIVSRLPELFELLEGVVEEEGRFDPASWSGSASIAMGSPATRCWGSALYEVLSKQAPNVTWN
ncbi:MAG: LysR family transcriptional regulator, partial [Pseudomonadales bacterium]